MKKNKSIEKILKDLKPIDAVNFPSYYISKKGKVYKVVNDTIKEIKASKYIKYDFLRVNMRDKEGRSTTKMLHTLVYETYKGKINLYDDLKFIDGDYKNCDIDNLITVSELLQFYKENNKVKEC